MLTWGFTSKIAFQVPIQSIYIFKNHWGNVLPDPSSLACWMCLPHAAEYHMKAHNLKITPDK